MHNNWGYQAFLKASGQNTVEIRKNYDSSYFATKRHSKPANEAVRGVDRKNMISPSLAPRKLTPPMPHGGLITVLLQC